ncbi:hypothetical protein V2J09_018276 [Rumex salicifolius]
MSFLLPVCINSKTDILRVQENQDYFQGHEICITLHNPTTVQPYKLNALFFDFGVQQSTDREREKQQIRRRSSLSLSSPLDHSPSPLKIQRPMMFGTQIPRWVEVLLQEKFFRVCSVHELDRKNEKNILCLDCCVAVCVHCLAPHHRSHRLLQIRRYVYHDVIRLEDADKLIDCSSVQLYINNGAKVVFLNQRPQARPFRTAGNVCITCNRCLQDPFSFCSLSCKVTHLLKTEGSISNHLLECNYLPLPGLSELDDGQITPDSVLEPARPSSGSAGGSAGGLVEWFKNVGVGPATVEIVRKKRSSLNAGRTRSSPVCSPVEVVDNPGSALMNRRKNCTPHRADGLGVKTNRRLEIHKKKLEISLIIQGVWASGILALSNSLAFFSISLALIFFFKGQSGEFLLLSRNWRVRAAIIPKAAPSPKMAPPFSSPIDDF